MLIEKRAPRPGLPYRSMTPRLTRAVSARETLLLSALHWLAMSVASSVSRKIASDSGIAESVIHKYWSDVFPDSHWANDIPELFLSEAS